MRIRAGYEIAYECHAPTPMVLMLNVRPERARDLEGPDLIRTWPQVPMRAYHDSFGNFCTRLLAPAGRLSLSADFVIRDSGLPDESDPGAEQWPVDRLPDEALLFLMGSRYCEVDALSDQAWKLFGGIEPGWGRAQAIVDYVHERITFGYPHARCTRTALEAHEERRGVCRDFAHLAVALCRCMNIPARYCTGYLGDIGVPPSDSPMDFSAWFEVFLGGSWHTLDARHNARRIGRIKIAHGRDATDVAMITTFASAQLAGFKVVTDELADLQLRRVG